jgi:pimeloyl-ACP methyl ester carboxylesterase
VHGLWLSGWCLLALRRRLERCGFDARHTFSYPSVSHNLLENAEALSHYLRDLDAPVVHLVGHSLGGLVIRALFHQHPEQPRGRIVTLGSPHRGSYPASVLARTRLGRKITGNSIQQLLAGMPEYWELPARDFGVICGDLGIGMGRLFPGFVKPNDGVVALAEARPRPDSRAPPTTSPYTSRILRCLCPSKSRTRSVISSRTAASMIREA